jgi:DnaK suppressor protein
MSPDTQVRKRGPVSHLPPEALEDFEQLLLDRRRTVVSSLRTLEGGGIELVETSDDAAEAAQDVSRQDLSLACMESLSKELKEIDSSLDRIRDRSFGVCEECNSAIPRERLEAIPHARLCIPCKSREEAEGASA